MHRVSFLESWFGRFPDMVKVLDVLQLVPTEIQFDLSSTVEPPELVAGLEAAGWQLTSQLEHKVEAGREGFQVIVEPSTLTFRGFSPRELLESGEPTGKQSTFAAGVLALLGGKKE